LVTRKSETEYSQDIHSLQESECGEERVCSFYSSVGKTAEHPSLKNGRSQVRVLPEAPITSVCRNEIDGDESNDKRQTNVMLVESQNNGLPLWDVNMKFDMVVRIHLLTPIYGWSSERERLDEYQSRTESRAQGHELA